MSMMQAFQDFLDPESKQRKLEEQRKKAYRDSLKGPQVNSDTSGIQAAAAQGAAQHFGVQQDAIADVNDAIATEMQSRVNQQREMRRMAHAQEMERIRQEGILRRIQAEQQAEERMMRLKQNAAKGVISRLAIDRDGNVVRE